ALRHGSGKIPWVGASLHEIWFDVYGLQSQARSSDSTGFAGYVGWLRLTAGNLA
ncbi:MAG: hypothetical protein H7Z18_06115, partial [Methylophilaceae bacterium]|nr:hypothetical protein [Methylophilaceae bacterium]